MPRPSDSALDRRRFLKATDGVGAVGVTGYAATLLSADGAESTLRVAGRDDATTYTVVLGDADAGSGSDDDVQHTGGKTRIQGSVDDEDRYGVNELVHVELRATPDRHLLVQHSHP